MKINQSTPPYKQKTYHHPPMVNVYTPYNIPFFSVAPQPRSFCLWQKAWKCGKRKKKVINRTVDNFVDKLFLKQSTAVCLKISTSRVWLNFLNCKNFRCFFNLHDALMFFVGFFQEFYKEKINCTNNVHLNKN